MPYEGPGPYWLWNAAGEGTNNDRLQAADPGGSTLNGSCRFTSGTATYILHKPGVTLVTTPAQTAQPAAIAGQGFGYNILKSDMNASANLPAKRRIPAGDWTFKVVLNIVAADLDTVFGFYVNIYKRSSAGALTHVAGGQSNLDALLAGDNDRAATVSSVPEITLETDETIHVEYWMRGNQAITGNNDLSLSAGNPAIGDVSNVLLPDVGLRYLYPRSVSAPGSGAVVAPVRTTKRLIVAAASGAAALGARTTRKAFTVAGAALSAMTQRLTFKRSFAVAGSPLAAVSKNTKRALAVVADATAAMAARLTLRRAFVVGGEGGVSFARRLTLLRSFSVAATPATLFSRVVRSQRAFSVAGAAGAAFARRLSLFRAFAVAGDGGASIQRRSRKAFVVAAAPAVAFGRVLTAARVFTVAATPGTFFARVARSRRAFEAAGTADTRLWLLLPESVIDRMVSGGTTIVRKFIAIFDD